MKIAVIIITYNRVDDAKINMELIRHLWTRQEKLRDIALIHVFNGRPEWYPHSYLEDVLLRTENRGHFEGAAAMIDEGIGYVLKEKKKYDYIVVLSADTWLVKPEKVAAILEKMQKEKKLLTTSLWFSAQVVPNNFATEFFIIDPRLAAKVFPLKVDEFDSRHSFLAKVHKIVDPLPMLAVPKVELSLTDNIWQEFAANHQLLAMKDRIMLTPGRKLVWVGNRHFSPDLGYFSHHDLKKKLKLLGKLKPEIFKAEHPFVHLRACFHKLNGSSNLSDSGRP